MISESVEQPKEEQQVQISDADKEKKQRMKKMMEHIKILQVLKMLQNDTQPIMVLPQLYIGSLAAAYSEENLKACDIKFILTVCDSPKKFPFIEYLKINVADKNNTPITEHFTAANNFIDGALTQNSNIMVHCFAGKSRSVAFILAYLIERRNMGYEEALQTIKAVRPLAQPNLGFVQQIKSYYNLD